VSVIYVLGHKNPDTDSICSAYCYAAYKQYIDPSNTYIPAMCGTPNEQTRFIFEKCGIDLPPYLRDLHHRVQDVYENSIISLNENEPILEAIKVFQEHKIRTLPIVNDEGQYQGIVSLLEMTQFFIPTDYYQRPEHVLRPENFAKVLPGYFLKTAETQEFRTRFMVGAMSYETFLKRLEKTLCYGKDDCRNPVLIVGNRMDILEYAVQHDFPAIVLTGVETDEEIAIDISQFKGWIYVSETDTAETVRLLRTSTPVKTIANKNVPTTKLYDTVEQVKSQLKKLDHRGMAVIDSAKLIGLVSMSDLIDPKPKQVIMIDHNELSQGIEGIDKADIVEVIDHHRMGIQRTDKPIYIYAKPIGSSCTLVYQHYQMSNLAIPPQIAALLLSGILTDTVILRSPTTTRDDREAVEKLSQIANLSHIEWGKEIFSSAGSLMNADPAKVIAGDTKTYQEYGIRVGISQVEVITLHDLDTIKDAYFRELENARLQHRLDWMMLLVTDILMETSTLLMTPFEEIEDFLSYTKVNVCEYSLPGILSRKKQLLPEILNALREYHKSKDL